MLHKHFWVYSLIFIVFALLTSITLAWAAPAHHAGTDIREDVRIPLSFSRSLPENQPRFQQSQVHSVTYLYDGAGRLAQVDYGRGHIIIFTYDAAGNLLRRQVMNDNPIYLPIFLGDH
jgi:YD repeat-containing protein